VGGANSSVQHSNKAIFLKLSGLIPNISNKNPNIHPDDPTLDPSCHVHTKTLFYYFTQNFSNDM